MSLFKSKCKKLGTQFLTTFAILSLLMTGITTSCNNEKANTPSPDEENTKARVGTNSLDEKRKIIDQLTKDEDFIDYFKTSFEADSKKQKYKKEKKRYSENYITEDYDEFLKKFNNNGVVEDFEKKAVEDFLDYPEKDTYKKRKNASFKKLLKKYSQSLADTMIVRKAFVALNDKLNPSKTKQGAGRLAGCYNPECDVVFVAYERMANLDREVIEFNVKGIIAVSGFAGIDAAALYLGSRLGGKAMTAFLNATWTYVLAGSGYDPVDTIANMAGDMMYVSTVTDGQAQYCACQRKNGCPCTFVSPAWWYSRGNNTLLPMPMY